MFGSGSPDRRVRRLPVRGAAAGGGAFAATGAPDPGCYTSSHAFTDPFAGPSAGPHAGAGGVS